VEEVALAKIAWRMFLKVRSRHRYTVHLPHTVGYILPSADSYTPKQEVYKTAPER